MKITEVKAGDVNARAGLLITDGEHFLVCKPTPSSRYPHPELDIPKGHLRLNEQPIDAALRECYEETNIRFEPWKLNAFKKFTLYGEPFFVWEVYLSELPSLERLSCKSNFIDDASGRELPEMAGYAYIEIRSLPLNAPNWMRHLIDKYYGENQFMRYPFEDNRCCADRLNVPDGVYKGYQSGSKVTLNNGITFKTVTAVKGRNIFCSFKVIKGFIYANLNEDCQLSGSLGSPPPNVGTVLSLGYKNAYEVPPFKKKVNSSNFSTFPKL